MDQAIKQLRGTKEYAALLDSLSNDDRIVLTLLSKCPHGASTDELTALLILDGLGDLLRLTPIRELSTRLDETGARREPCEKSLEKMRTLGDKWAIRVLNTDLQDRVIYRVEDQWVSAYFRYSGFQTFVNLEYGLIAGESGILIFGDPISSILDSIFLHKIMKSFAQGDSFKVNYYPNDGSNLRSHSGKILNASFVRVADGKTWHLGFNLEASTDTNDIKTGMIDILRKLQDIGVIKAFQVRERILGGPWL